MTKTFLKSLELYCQRLFYKRKWIRIVLSLECPINKLANIHDLDGDLIPFGIGGHGTDALLTGRHDSLGASCQNFFNFLLGNLG